MSMLIIICMLDHIYDLYIFNDLCMLKIYFIHFPTVVCLKACELWQRSMCWCFNGVILSFMVSLFSAVFKLSVNTVFHITVLSVYCGKIWYYCMWLAVQFFIGMVTCKSCSCFSLSECKLVCVFTCIFSKISSPKGEAIT